MAKQFLILLIASFVLANFIAEDHLVNAAATAKGTKGESNKKSTKNIDTESSQDLDVSTGDKEVNETKDTKALETNGLVTNSEGKVGDNDLNGDNGTEGSETSKGKRRKNKRDRSGKRRRNKERKQRKTINKDINSTEEQQERESNNVGEYEEAEPIDTTTMSQELEQSEIATTSEKSNTSEGNRKRPNKRDVGRRSGGNDARQRGKNGNGRRRGAGAKRSGAGKMDRIARKQPGRSAAKGKSNKLKLNGFRLPKSNGGKAANKIGRNSRFGRNRY